MPFLQQQRLSPPASSSRTFPCFLFLSLSIRWRCWLPFLIVLLILSNSNILIKSGIHGILAQCPHKIAPQTVINVAEEIEEQNENGINDDSTDADRPALKPHRQFIQTTFVHRDANDQHREYVQFIELKLAELRPRLHQNAFLTLDNVNIDCGGVNEEQVAVNGAHQWTAHQCQEYPLAEAYHFLVVEDSRNGAAVYSLSVERNWAGERGRARTLGRVEMALLDALSRHSTLPLVGFASAQADHELGFVRALSSAELQAFIRQNHARLISGMTKSNKQTAQMPSHHDLSIETRSPLELRLLNERIVRNREPDFEKHNSDGKLSALLRHFHGPELVETIEYGERDHAAVFVLFWSETSVVGQHALHIWAKTAEKWRRNVELMEANNKNKKVDANKEGDKERNDESTTTTTTNDDKNNKLETLRNVHLGAVNCEEEREVCRAFGVFLHGSQPSGHDYQLLAYWNGHRLSQQLALGDERFLAEWMHLLLSGPLLQLRDATEVARMKKMDAGVLSSFSSFWDASEQQSSSPLPVPAVFPPSFSVGRFRDEQQEEFRAYRRVGTLLAGRYYLTYLLDANLPSAQLSTFRRTFSGDWIEHDEDEFQEVPYLGSFELRSLLSHITHTSMPNILDIGHGFTTELVLQATPALLMIHNSSQNSDDASNSNRRQEQQHQMFRKAFAAIGQQLRVDAKREDGEQQQQQQQSTQKQKNHHHHRREHFMLFELNRANALPTERLMRELGMQNGNGKAEERERDDTLPALCLLNLQEICCAFRLKEADLQEAKFIDAIREFVRHGMIIPGTSVNADNDKNERKEDSDGRTRPWTMEFPHKVPLDLMHNPHPLQQLQLEQTHRIFGSHQQQVLRLDPEPIEKLLSDGSSNSGRDPHNFVDQPAGGGAAISGCPMMAHLNSLHDEL